MAVIAGTSVDDRSPIDVHHATGGGTSGYLYVTYQGYPSCTVSSPGVSSSLTTSSTPAVEVYFARCLGFSLLTIAMLTVMLTGSIPLSSTVSDPVSTEDSDPKAPYAFPTLIITCAFHSLSAAYAYTRYVDSSQVAFAIGLAVYGLVAAVGLWCVLFASSNGRISRKTGADKRTAGFPFKNLEASKKHAGKKRS